MCRASREDGAAKCVLALFSILGSRHVAALVGLRPFGGGDRLLFNSSVYSGDSEWSLVEEDIKGSRTAQKNRAFDREEEVGRGHLRLSPPN